MDTSRSADHPPDGGAPLYGPPGTVALVRRRLLDFFDRHARDLPWRRTADPYRIWISEVMLQQTRVGTALPYYRRFIDSFPDVDALAAAPLDRVLKSWEGLGYYSRARHLHRAARMVRDRHGGALPSTVDGLRELPGVGPYTAGAVASIAFGRATPAVDGNVRRVLARLLDLPEPGPAELRDAATALVDPERPGDFNQALMELGATVCTPTSPGCGSCPLTDVCRSRAQGVQESRPLPRTRGPLPERHFGVAVVVARSHPRAQTLADALPSAAAQQAANVGARAEDLVILVRRRPEEALLGGLWEFPTGEMAAGEAPEGAALAATRLDPDGVRRIHLDDRLPEVPHVFSHFRALYRPVAFEVRGERRGEREEPGDPEDRRWLAPHELDEIALPAAQRTIARAAVRLLLP